MSRNPPVVEGATYGRWTALWRDEETSANYRARTGTSRAYWVCQCACGSLSSVAGTQLARGRSLSCGCAQGLSRTEVV